MPRKAHCDVEDVVESLRRSKNRFAIAGASVFEYMLLIKLGKAIRVADDAGRTGITVWLKTKNHCIIVVVPGMIFLRQAVVREVFDNRVRHLRPAKGKAKKFISALSGTI